MHVQSLGIWLKWQVWWNYPRILGVPDSAFLIGSQVALNSTALDLSSHIKQH